MERVDAEVYPKRPLRPLHDPDDLPVQLWEPMG
jgi:hypothetical protein